MERKKNGVELTARKSRRECFVKCKFDRDRSSAIDSTHKKKVHSYFYILLAKKKSLSINANHSLFKKSQLKCFFFSSDQEVISKVDKTISRKANLHTLSSIIVFHHLFSIILRLLKFI